MSKKSRFEPFKEGLSLEELEHFATQHTTEIFSFFAFVIAVVSSAFHFFTGPKIAIFFLAIGALAALFSFTTVERWLKQFYCFTIKQEKMTEIVLGCVKIVVAIFVPFFFFLLIGLLAGTSYHYYIRQAQIFSSNHPEEFFDDDSEEEHD